MKRKTSKIITIILAILALILMLGFNDPYSVSFGWPFYLGLLIMLGAIILDIAVCRCPYCDKLLTSESLVRPYKNCPYCGSDIKEN